MAEAPGLDVPKQGAIDRTIEDAGDHDLWEVPDTPSAAAEELVAMIRESECTTEQVCRRVCDAVKKLGPAVLDTLTPPVKKTVLATAADKECISLCRLCLELGADPDTECIGNSTALHCAACLQDGQCARLLLEHGAAVTSTGTSPLHVACDAGGVDLLPLLLEHGAELDVTDAWRGETPLFVASKRGSIAHVQFLLERGAEKDTLNRYGQSSLVIACLRRRIAVARLLLESGASDDVPSYHVSPLWVACAIGDAHRAQRLLEDGADVDKRANLGKSPLHMACANGHVDCVRLLLAHGASIDLEFLISGTPLLVACENGNLDCAHLLIDRGADAAWARHDGHAPIHIACQNGHLGLARALLERLGSGGVDVTRAGGLTALHLACGRNRRPIALLLLEHGADPTIRSTSGDTPAVLARAGRQHVRSPAPDPELAEAMELAESDRAAAMERLREMVARDHAS